MDLKDKIQEKLKLDSSKIYFDEPMKKHTSFKIGGDAESFIVVDTIEDLKKVCAFAKENNIKLSIIGNGSNLLVLDKGIRGIVAKINIKKFEIENKKNFIKLTVGAGNKLGEIAQKLLKNEITGFEFASGIPGTIGGAVRMNAGAYGGEMKDIIEKVTYMDYSGNIFEKTKEELEFEYRKSFFKDKEYVILEAVINLHKGKQEEIQGKMKKYEKARKEKQPIEYPSAGSTFKRGNDFVTAKLIDEIGLKGYSIGGAEVSTKHSGFIINKGGATAKDVLEVVQYVQSQVLKEFGKKIELEIEVIGEEI